MKPPEFLIQDSRNIMMSLQITKLSKKYFINFLIIRYTVMGMGILNPELLGLGTSLIFKYINNLKKKKKSQVSRYITRLKIQNISSTSSYSILDVLHITSLHSPTQQSINSPPHLLATCNLCSFWSHFGPTISASPTKLSTSMNLQKFEPIPYNMTD